MLVSIVTKEDLLTYVVFCTYSFDGQKDKKLNTVFGAPPCKKRFVSLQPINVCLTSDLLPFCSVR